MEKIRTFFTKHWKWALPSVVLAMLAGGILVATGTGLFDPATPPVQEVVQKEEPPVVPKEPDVEVEPIEEHPSPAPEPSELNIESTKTMKYSKVWNPPDGGQYFWQVVDPQMGYPATGGTDYVLAHACEKQTCAGDKIRDVQEGNTIQYKGDTYFVDEKISIMKDELPKLDIWEHYPDRLIVITCIIETTWWASDKNDVIIATKVDG